MGYQRHVAICHRSDSSEYIVSSWNFVPEDSDQVIYADPEDLLFFDGPDDYTGRLNELSLQLSLRFPEFTVFDNYVFKPGCPAIFSSTQQAKEHAQKHGSALVSNCPRGSSGEFQFKLSDGCFTLVTFDPKQGKRLQKEARQRELRKHIQVCEIQKAQQAIRNALPEKLWSFGFSHRPGTNDCHRLVSLCDTVDLIYRKVGYYRRLRAFRDFRANYIKRQKRSQAHAKKIAAEPHQGPNHPYVRFVKWMDIEAEIKPSRGAITKFPDVRLTASEMVKG